MSMKIKALHEKLDKINSNKYILTIVISCLVFLGLLSSVFSSIGNVFLILFMVLWYGLCFVLSFENLLCIMLFQVSFLSVDFISFPISFYNILSGILVFCCFIKYVVNIIEKKEKIMSFPLLMICILFFYGLLFFNLGGINYFFGYNVLFVLLYLTYVHSNKIDKYKLCKYLIIGLLISAMISSLLLIFGLDTLINITDDKRFMALTGNPNNLQVICVLSLVFVSLMFFKSKISLWKFGILFPLILIIGLMTKSKSFLICLVLLMCVLCVWLIVKYRKKPWFWLACVGGLVFLGIFYFVFRDCFEGICQRFFSVSGKNGLDRFFTGRVSIWKKYIDVWTSSAVSIIFGCGMSANETTMFNDLVKGAHSGYVDLIYRFGVIGNILILIFIISLVRAIKNKKSGFKLVNILPLLFFMILSVSEYLLTRFRFTLILSVLFIFDNNIEESGDFNGHKGGFEMFKKLRYLKFSHIISVLLMIVSFVPSMIAKIFIRDFWLVCEEKNEARDNGYWLFKYIRENHPKQKVAYAINKKCKDYQKVKPLGKIIQYGSLSHWFWYFVADKNISSQKGGKPSNAVCYFLEVVLKLRKNNRVFLQHGVIKNNLYWLYFKETNMRMFTTSTYQEFDYVNKLYGYPDGYVKLLGLPRFDNLSNKNLKKNQILVMPTWRNWIAKEVDCKKYEGTNVFTETEFYKSWSTFLNSEKLDKWLEKNNKTIVFYPHRNMQKYIDHFGTNSKHIIIANSNEYDVQQLLNESSVLITDYSSVCFDFGYLEKPIIFYQFDEEKFRLGQYEQGYFDYHDNDLGVWTDSIDGVVDYLDKIAKKKLLNKFDSKKVFKYIDQNNCKRNYEAIKNLKFENKINKNKNER